MNALNITDEAMTKITQKSGVSLRRIELVDCPNVTNETFKLIKSNCCNLESIAVIRCSEENLEDDGFEFFLNNPIKSLNSITIHVESLFVTDATISALASCNGNFTHIDIQGTYSYTL